MALFGKLFAKKDRLEAKEAVLISIDGAISDDFWELNERLYQEIARSGAGEFDGNEVGQDSATLFAYGPNADQLFQAIEPVLRSYPVCRNARVVIRHGGPGSPQTELKL